MLFFCNQHFFDAFSFFGLYVGALFLDCIRYCLSLFEVAFALSAKNLMEAVCTAC